MSVYYIHSPDTGLVKIGFAGNPVGRLSKMQTDSPTRLVMLAIEDGNEAVEAERHRAFEAYRARGEWFRFEGTLQAFISNLAPYVQVRSRKPLGGKLGAWLIENDLTLAEFGARVGVTYATICRYCAGTHKPSADQMEKIAHATRGAVLPNDWFPSLALISQAQDEAA